MTTTRTVKDYRPQHDEDCAVNLRYKCTCGLSALLQAVDPPVAATSCGHTYGDEAPCPQCPPDPPVEGERRKEEQKNDHSASLLPVDASATVSTEPLPNDGRCYSCRFVRDRGSVGFMCANDDESHPMNWQDTYADFGCNAYQPKIGSGNQAAKEQAAPAHRSAAQDSSSTPGVVQRIEQAGEQRDRVKAIVLQAQRRIESELPEDEHDHIPEWCYVAIVETALQSLLTPTGDTPMISYRLAPLEFHRRLVWFMEADPWPEPDVEFDAPATMTRRRYEDDLNVQAHLYGLTNWVEAYHYFDPRETEADALLRIAFTQETPR